MSSIDKEAELAYLTAFVRESDFDESITLNGQLRALWTAFCLHHNLDVDTAAYDAIVCQLWQAMTPASRASWSDFGSFDDFMCEYLV